MGKVTQLQLRRGLVSALPTLAEGELGYATDTKDLYIGTSSGNQKYQANLTGLLSAIPSLGVGQTYFATDIYRLYVGSASGNLPLITASKKYKAKIEANDSSVSAVAVFENTLGGTPTFSGNSGTFSITLNSAFTYLKTLVLVNGGSAPNNLPANYYCNYDNVPNRLDFITDFAYIDGDTIIIDLSIEVFY